MKPCHHDECVSCTVNLSYATPRAAESARELLLSTLDRTHAKYECLDCRMISEPSEPMRIRYEEQWSSEAAFITHATSDEFRRVLNAMDLCGEMPEVKVERLYTDRGIECLKTLLRQAAHTTSPPGGTH